MPAELDIENRFSSQKYLPDLDHNVKPSLTNAYRRSPLPDLNCSPVVDDLRQLLHDVAKNAKLELMRGNGQAVKELLEALIEPDLEVVLDV